jgi:hypothetical protein
VLILSSISVPASNPSGAFVSPSPAKLTLAHGIADAASILGDLSAVITAGDASEGRAEFFASDH